MTPVPSEKTAIACVPSGKEVPQPPVRAARQRRADELPCGDDPRAGTCRRRSSSRARGRRAVGDADHATRSGRRACGRPARPVCGIPEVDVAGEVAGRDRLRRRARSGSSGSASWWRIVRSTARRATFQMRILPSRPALASSRPSALKSRSWSVLVPRHHVADQRPVRKARRRAAGPDRSACRRRRSRRAGRPARRRRRRRRR